MQTKIKRNNLLVQMSIKSVLKTVLNCEKKITIVKALIKRVYINLLRLSLKYTVTLQAATIFNCMKKSSKTADQKY